MAAWAWLCLGAVLPWGAGSWPLPPGRNRRAQLPSSESFLSALLERVGVLGAHGPMPKGSEARFVAAVRVARKAAKERPVPLHGKAGGGIHAFLLAWGAEVRWVRGTGVAGVPGK